MLAMGRRIFPQARGVEGKIHGMFDKSGETAGADAFSNAGNTVEHGHFPPWDHAHPIGAAGCRRRLAPSRDFGDGEKWPRTAPGKHAPFGFFGKAHIVICKTVSACHFARTRAGN